MLAVITAACLVVSGCDIIDDEDLSSAQSPEQQAYAACQPTYREKSASLPDHWAFVSGIDGSGRASCYSWWKAGTSAEAARLAYDSCRKSYESCFIFATSDGPSEWVRKMSDNLRAAEHQRTVTLSRADDSSDADDGRPTVDDDDASSFGDSFVDFLGGLADFLNATNEVVRATKGGGPQGRTGSRGGESASIPAGSGFSQRGAFDDCASLFAQMGDAEGAEKCALNSKNMETAH
jgi:hypothetical protein